MMMRLRVRKLLVRVDYIVRMLKQFVRKVSQFWQFYSWDFCFRVSRQSSRMPQVSRVSFRDFQPFVLVYAIYFLRCSLSAYISNFCNASPNGILSIKQLYKLLGQLHPFTDRPIALPSIPPTFLKYVKHASILRSLMEKNKLNISPQCYYYILLNLQHTYTPTIYNIINAHNISLYRMMPFSRSDVIACFSFWVLCRKQVCRLGWFLCRVSCREDRDRGDGLGEVTQWQSLWYMLKNYQNVRVDSVSLLSLYYTSRFRMESLPHSPYSHKPTC